MILVFLYIVLTYIHKTRLIDKMQDDNVEEQLHLVKNHTVKAWSEIELNKTNVLIKEKEYMSSGVK